MPHILDHFPGSIDVSQQSIPEVYARISKLRRELDAVEAREREFFGNAREADRLAKRAESLQDAIDEGYLSLGERAYFLIEMQMKEGEN